MKRQKDIYLAWAIMSGFLSLFAVVLIPVDLNLIKPEWHLYAVLSRGCFIYGYGLIAVMSFWFRSIMIWQRSVLITFCFQLTVVGIYLLENLAGGLSSGYNVVIVQTSMVMGAMLFRFPKLLILNLTLMCGSYLGYHFYSSEPIDPTLKANLLWGIVSCYTVGLIISMGLFVADKFRRKKDNNMLAAENALMHEIRTPLNHIHNLLNELQRDTSKVKELAAKTAAFASFIMTIQSGASALRKPTDELYWGVNLYSAILHSKTAYHNIIDEISKKCAEAMINIDPALLTMLIVNLADNAGKYASDCKLYLSAKLSKDFIKIITRTLPINTSDFNYRKPRLWRWSSRPEKIREMSTRICNGSTNRGSGYGLFIIAEILDQTGGSTSVLLIDGQLEITITLPLKKFGLNQVRFSDKVKIEGGSIV